VAEWRSSGLSARAFCEGKELSTQTLYRRAARLMAPGAADAGAAGVQLAQVVRRPAPLEARTSVPSGGVWVELNGARVVVPLGAELSTLMVALEALKATGDGVRR